MASSPSRGTGPRRTEPLIVRLDIGFYYFQHAQLREPLSRGNQSNPIKKERQLFLILPFPFFTGWMLKLSTESYLPVYRYIYIYTCIRRNSLPRGTIARPFSRSSLSHSVKFIWTRVVCEARPFNVKSIPGHGIPHSFWDCSQVYVHRTRYNILSGVPNTVLGNIVVQGNVSLDGCTTTTVFRTDNAQCPVRF